MVRRPLRGGTSMRVTLLHLSKSDSVAAHVNASDGALALLLCYDGNACTVKDALPVGTRVHEQGS